MTQIENMTQLVSVIFAFLITIVTLELVSPWYKIWETFSQFIIQVGSFILLFLAPIKDYVHLVIILLAFDVFTGVWASINEGGIKAFEAKKLKKTLSKFILYGSAIIIGYILQLIINDGTELARIVAVFIGATEAKSSYENISKITGTDLLINIWNVISSKMNDYFKNIKTQKKS